jgi:hypothetical protein
LSPPRPFKERDDSHNDWSNFWGAGQKERSWQILVGDCLKHLRRLSTSISITEQLAAINGRYMA